MPESLRIRGLGSGTGAFGVYAFWVYCTQTGDRHAVVSHWPAIKLRMLPLLGRNDPFDPQRTNYTHDEAETLNGNLAGLIGLARLARLNRDAELEARARVGVSNLLTLRVNLERVNPRILEPTESSSKSLHTAKLARYGHLVPEVADAVRRWSDGAGPERLQAFREARNGWHLAFGDRLVGGENYTNPPHFVRALFGGAVFVEQLPAEDIIGFVDVPWCRGDFHFMEQCVLALWAAAGRPWETAE